MNLILVVNKGERVIGLKDVSTQLVLDLESADSRSAYRQKLPSNFGKLMEPFPRPYWRNCDTYVSTEGMKIGVVIDRVIFLEYKP